MAVKYNLNDQDAIDAGATYVKQITLLGQNGPFDLTGYSVASQLKVGYTDVTASADFTCSVASPPTSGTFQLELHASSSAQLTGKCYL
jgi:hypothetical protein